ncbi:unnamed protein product [Dibothriocephalus latus]|uniref:Uncharacterized protein n=1 Tax=Dibothriocephalus latus TaxID=60516 RepID=A0A3P7P2W2_DIBLA|nr:unnamed protein product [Dibothriocephalus latus]
MQCVCLLAHALDKVKSKTGFSERGPLQVTDKKASRTGASTCPSLSREPSLEEHELQRELQSTKEREADLSEQLRFAEEEIRKLTRRITEAQAESDVLSRQVERLNAAQGSGSRGSSPRSSTPFAKKGSEFQTPVQAGLKDQSGSESEIIERRTFSGLFKNVKIYLILGT